ncbi:cytochrome c oxidase subunit 3 [Bizionia paragorgiae]|jgi:cytochrome c oxidase subunit III|uniref:Cytochrome c oxidase subunit 3 n=1 Tax=Bizionia paragorgiae TaxID=283786 RepID=A0A1H4BV91_BIZPA|nr:cytochrome c oxidase subunit 3 [Bizionia paragorgiae]MDX1270454.1 cytochrome c oxidase subunit 3 [Bizionia paragorgiae]SEA52010.1 cytochrome c oxidase subunit 3 [Bizionia paragorgiae]
MDLTQGTLQEKNNRAKKMMLWFGIISLIMTFAGFTSAVIVSSSRPDWSADMQLPNVFIYSVFAIVISSITFILAKRALKQDDRKKTSILLLITLVLGSVFITLQFVGFGQLIDAGYYLTGPTSDPKASFVFLIAFVHILHVLVGLICLVVVIYNHFKQKYTATNMLGMELAATFWHFVDILWVYLFLFLYFLS